MEAQISEIFNSIQGEGPYAGVRQVFVRFVLCQLRCAYCDTPHSETEYCRIEEKPGTGDFKYIKNPLSRDDVAETVRLLWSPSTRHVSLTGGEPLLHVDFIKSLDIEYPLYLETNSGFPEKAEAIKDMVDIASCDIKLPEHGAADNYDELLRKELETVSVLNGSAVTFVKIVVLPETTPQSIAQAVDGIASIDRNIPLILQPVTSTDMSIAPAQLVELMDFAGKELNIVRVLPQIHRMMGLL